MILCEIYLFFFQSVLTLLEASFRNHRTNLEEDTQKEEEEEEEEEELLFEGTYSIGAGT